MKKLLLLSAILFTFFTLQAQVDIKEGTLSMSQGSQNGFTMEFEGLDKGTVEKLWEKHVKDYKGKMRKVKKSDERVADDSEIKGASENTIDIYSLVTKQGSEVTRISVWFDLGGAFLSSKTHPDRYPAVEKMLLNFAVETEREKVRMEIKVQEDVMKKMEKDMDSYRKEQKQMEEDIEKYREKIKEAEARIEQAVQNQKVKQEEIKTQGKMIETTKDRMKTLKKAN